jgi:outer membrane lipoprotein-sorting protein
VSRARRLAAIVALLCSAACAGPPRLALPSGPGQPLDDPGAIASREFARCAGLRTLTAEIGVSGRAGRQKLRARLIAGFADPGSLRLEAVAPFGAPGFILVSNGGTATLLLPRDDRVLTGARPGDVLEALAGISLSPDDLRLVLAACPAATPAASAATAYGTEWTVLDLGAAGTAYLRTTAGERRLAAVVRPDWIAEYPERTASGAPTMVRLRDAVEPPRVDVRLRLSQVEINVAVPDEAFRVNVPPSAVPISLDELREAGPLGETRNAERGTRN